MYRSQLTDIRHAVSEVANKIGSMDLTLCICGTLLLIVLWNVPNKLQAIVNALQPTTEVTSDFTESSTDLSPDAGLTSDAPGTPEADH